MRSRVKILNIEIDNFSTSDLLQQLTSGFLVTANADHLMHLQENEEFREVYRHADFISADSQIVYWAAHFLCTPLKEKISGSDFFPAYCDYHKENLDIQIYILGALPGVAARAAENINERIGREIIVGTHSPVMGFDASPQECQDVIDIVNESHANVLVVGLGAPRQEIWVTKYMNKFTNIRTFMALGATIDYEAGRLKRSPKWMSACGIEWIYRLFQEPYRLWKRYLVYDTRFPFLVIKQRLGLYRPPA